MMTGRTKHRLVAALVVLMLAVPNGSGEVRVAPSLEWLTCQAEVIVVGKIKTVTTTKGTGPVIYEDCVVQVEEVLKGQIKGGEVTFCLRSSSPNSGIRPSLNRKGDTLFFLWKSKGHGPKSHLNGKYVPTSLSPVLTILNLADPPKHIYSRDMVALADRDQILRVVRDWSKSRIVHSLWSEVGHDSPIHRHLYSGSVCYLVVPADEKYHAHFLKLARSEVVQERVRAARELHKFPGNQTEVVLRELLTDDTGTYSYTAQDIVSSVRYSVRAAAARSLRKLGKAVPELTFARKPTPEEQRQVRQRCWRGEFTNALTDGWAVDTVKDGRAWRTSLGGTATVIVTCKKDKLRCSFTLVPKEWKDTTVPGAEHLGINGPNSQGGRQFYLKDDLPKQVKEKVVRYFGLE